MSGLTTETAGKPPRRAFLRGLGIGGLTLAATVVGTETASANYKCCHLANYPANTTYAYCSAHANYIWTCQSSARIRCYCCETARNAKSAGRCEHE